MSFYLRTLLGVFTRLCSSLSGVQAPTCCGAHKAHHMPVHLPQLSLVNSTSTLTVPFVRLVHLPARNCHHDGLDANLASQSNCLFRS